MIGRIFVAFMLAGLVLAPTAGTPGRAGEGATQTYYFGILKRGPNRSQPPDEAQKIQAGHLQHIGEMAKMGKLVAAGPFGDDGDMRGILIFTTASADEALQLESTDPAVAAGRLVHEVHPWVGPVGIGTGWTEAVKTVKPEDIPMLTYQMVFLTRGDKAVPADASDHAALGKAHHDYVASLVASKKVVAAGPFTDGGPLMGVLVLNVPTVDDATALVSADPAVKGGFLVPTVHPWWCAKYVMPE